MRAWLTSLALVGLAACQPATRSDQPEATTTSPLVAAPEPQPQLQPAAYPEATGPVANYFRAELPVTFHGRWAADAAACAGAEALMIEGKSFTSPGLSAELGDIEVNEAAGAIIDVIANGKFVSAGQVSDGRASMKLSLDGSRLRVFVMGMPVDANLPAELGRCR